MNRVHQVLKLRHHKHTGKLLSHKHTSYRVLFLLMLAPIAMMALVGQLARASDYDVTATVPAPLPSGTPAIISPQNGSTVETPAITVSGSCPVAHPAVVIVISEGTNTLGSGSCQGNGTFSVAVSLSMGTHVIVATVVTITGQTGGASTPVSVTRVLQGSHATTATGSTIAGTTSLSLLPGIIVVRPSSLFLTLDSHRSVVWKGMFGGGASPYIVGVSWGDGSNGKYTVTNGSEQAFQHTYMDNKAYQIVINVTDTAGAAATENTAVVTMNTAPAKILDIGQPSSNPFVGFVQQYIVQIYIGTFFSLTFLWYLEHGRHLLPLRHPPRTRRHSH